MLDVAIIGGGVCGCSLLYQLSLYKVKAVLLEKENDVGVGTTKANSAIVHAGYDPLPGTLMAGYNVRGNVMVRQLCKDLDILFKSSGSLVLAFDAEQEARVNELYRQGQQNGVPNMQLLNRAQTLKREPGLNPALTLALYAPTAGVVNPWELALAQAQVALQNGCEVRLNTPVLGIEGQAGHFVLKTGSGNVEARFVVNAAGVHADDVSRMAKDDSFNILPNRGQYFLLDKSQGDLVSHVVFQSPTKLGKGVLVAPTVHGNLIVGPSSEPAQKEETETTAEVLAGVKRSALQSVPGIQFGQSIRNFAGVRAASNTYDFIVGESKTTPGFFQMAGIKSPGLTAAPAIAEDIVRMLGNAGLSLVAKAQPVTTRQVFRFNHASQQQRRQAVAQNPLYGNIVCRCETVSEGEIVDALHRPLPPTSLDGVKRRCGPGMGRCQGGFCGPKVQQIIARQQGLSQLDVPQDRQGMQIVTGRTKQPKGGDAE